jgi:hypothetical protein
MGSKSSPQSLSIAFNDAEQQKAFLARTTNQPNLFSPRSFVVSRCFSFPSLGAKFLSCVLVTFRMKNVSVSSFDEENLSLKTNVEYH